jgi:L-amino acid N-acyltransferase YncA
MPKFGLDVGFQGESGSRSDVAKLSRLTQLRNWCAATGREGVAFIRRDNAASRAAHSKSGFREVAEFSYAGTDYLVAARTARPAA